MITLADLERFQEQDIEDVNLDDLVDISTIQIDRSKPVVERVISFIEQVGNPYLFKVGDTPVKITFNSDPNAPSLQKCLERILTRKL